MGYYDFPHTRNYDTDLGYLINWFITNKNKIDKNTAITIEKALSASEDAIKAYNSSTSASNSAELALELKNQTEALKNLMQDKIDQIDANTSRIDNLATIDQGSITTTADAELVDIRVAYNGTKYSSAGDSVRGQISEIKSNSVSYKTPNETDLNNITTTGFYVIGDNFVNTPNGKVGILIVYKGEPSAYQTYQLLISYSDLIIYVRNKKDNTWSDWYKVSYQHQNETNETNLDNISSNGFYFMYESITNAPYDNALGLLICYTRDSVEDYARYQIFIDYNYGNIYTRSKKGNQWTSWTGNKQNYGNRNIVWFGDSLSSLKPLPSDTCSYLGSNVTNCAVPGAVFDKSNNDSINHKYELVGFANLMNCMYNNDYSDIDKAISDFYRDDPSWSYESNLTNFKNLNWDNIDSAVVFSGTNDYWRSVVTISEFKSDIKNAFIKLMKKHPTIKIYTITPMYGTETNSPNSKGLIMSDYVNAIRDVCLDLHIPCLDLFHTSGINQYTANTLLSNDGLHQSDEGEKIISQKIAKFLNSN